MAGKVQPVPEGFHTVTPHLVIRGAANAIEFYQKAFGAEEIARMPGPDGKSIMHAEIKIGNSVVMVCDEFGEQCKGPQTLGGSPVALHLYVQDAKAAYDRAVKAGAKATMPLQDMFWGDRYGRLTDPYGHEWSIAQHIEDVSPEECARRGQEFMAQMSGKGTCGAGG